MEKPKLFAWLSIVLAVIGGALTFLVPDRWFVIPVTTGIHISLFLSFMIAVLHIAAAILFFWGLKHFKPGLQAAYRIICIGIILFGLAQVQVPFLVLFQLGDTIWVKDGIVVLPYLVPIILLFVGVRKFADLFGSPRKWMSFWLVSGVALAVAALTTLLPHSSTSLSELEFKGTVALVSWATVFLGVITTIIVSIKRTAGVAYQPALTRLAVALGANTFAGVSYVSVYLLFGDKNAFIDNGGSLLPYVFAGFFFMGAGYAFKQINEEITVPAASNQEPSNAGVLDIVLFLASQASSPQQIDPMLDDVRYITSNLATGQAPSPQQEQSLRKVYQNIEQYLVQKEPLRQFTAEGLRQKVVSNFGMSAADFYRITGQEIKDPTVPA